MSRVLYLVVCGAGPASNVDIPIAYAQSLGLRVQVLATAAAMEHFLDPVNVLNLSGYPVRTGYRQAGTPSSVAEADAIVVAPATYNTINKWAAGVSDTYVLSVLAERTGAGLPISVLPFVNSAFAANAVLHRSIETLRDSGVTVLFGPGGFEPHPPRTGGTAVERFPWTAAIDAVAQQLPDPE